MANGRLLRGGSALTRLAAYPAAAMMLLWISGSVLGETDAIPKEGDRAPDFSVTTDQGKHMTPTNYGGKLLALNFWHTACRPCVQELPSLSEFARTFRSEGVVVIAVSGDEDPAQYKRFLRDHHVQLQTYRDPSLKISKSYGTLMFPETYLIQDGRILRKVVGGTDWMSEQMASLVRKQLSRR